MIGRRALLVALSGAALLAAGCSSNPSTGPAASPALTSSADALSAAATAMKAVTSAHFTLTVNGSLPQLTVHQAEGDLTSSGQAQGHGTISQFGQLVEVDFAVIGKDLYLKGPTGGYTKIPAALAGQIYDPTAILNPDKGVAAVLAGLTSPGTLSTTDTSYTVTGTVPKALAAALVPGITADVPGSFAIERSSLRVSSVTLSPNGSDGKAASVVLALTDYDKAVTVTTPAT